MSKVQLVIVGGGAAGLAAAVTGAALGARVTLLERQDRVGKKILQTGNGRCNLSNIHVSPEAYNHPDFVRPTLERLNCGALRDFFARLGLLTWQDEAGRIYPVSDTASSVLDVLRLRCDETGVRTLCGFQAAELTPRSVRSADGRQVLADAILIASGGGTSLLRQAGHSMVPFSPVLCPLKTDTAPIRGLSGLRARCAVTLYRGGTAVSCLRGELLFRDYGVSGIVCFDLSRYAKPGDQLFIDLLPDMPEDELCKLLTQRRQAFPHREDAALLTGLFHSRVNAALLRAAGGTDPQRLARTIKGLTLTVEGCGDAKQAQVTRGGAATAEFDPVTLRSRHWENLYAAGEALDIDGACGGYNLHWAFASGMTAAGAAMGETI